MKIELEFRKHLNQIDIQFITACLSKSESEKNGLLCLLTDPNSVDQILDQPELLKSILNDNTYLNLSARLYFYLLVKHSLKQSAINSPELADYVSGILEFFLKYQRNNPDHESNFYLLDWLKHIEEIPPTKQFDSYVMTGNHLLFLTGIFPDYFSQRTRRRGAPDISYYKDIGRFSFQCAADHPINDLAEIGNLYATIANGFFELTRSLNDLSDRLIFMDTAHPFDLNSGAA